jgi:hypothetical protein
MRILVAAVLSLLASATSLADAGDGDKASAMLARVAVAVQADQVSAIQKFNAGADGFRDGNIYPFCFRLTDGVVITGQTAGSDIRTFPGSGQQIYDAALAPGDRVTEIAYLAKRPPPADATPVKKISVVRRIGEIGCGVGYYP